MATVGPQDEEELEEILESLGVTSVDDLPQVEVPPVEAMGSYETALPRQTIERTSITAGSAAILINDFRLHLNQLGVAFEGALVIDLIASYLSSQFILFAGPSGTGKSTAAHALQTFFAPADSRATIRARRQLLGPEDVAGYYSALGQVFVAGPDLVALDHLARPSASAPCPSLLVEEINLSAPEGYLNPMIHGFSGLSAESVEWTVFAESLEAHAKRPSALVFKPFPRLMGTINVDATAPAPAPKVVARACVVLLGPVETSSLDSVLEAMQSPRAADHLPALGAPYVGDPFAVLHSTAHRVAEVNEACMKMAGALESGGGSPDPGVPVPTVIKGLSRRQLAQIILYVSWFDVLAQGQAALDGTDIADPSVAAENAILHFVLPSLDAFRFSEAIETLGSVSLSTPSASGVGGILRSRIDRLAGPNEQAGFVGRVLDYWDRLS